MEISIAKFSEKRDTTGALTFLEAGRDIPISIKRVYYIYDVAEGEHRGFHAHKELEQYLICVCGGCTVLLEDTSGKKTIELKSPNEGLHVGTMVWHEMYDFKPGTVLLVLASDFYDESDYIRNYEEFLRILKEE